MRGIRLFLMTLALCGPALAQEPAQPLLTEGPISLTQEEGTDARIAARLREVLEGLSGYDEVSISVESGVVTFTGTALDNEAVSRLNQIATRTEGVVAVENQVEETTELAARLSPAVERFQARAMQWLAFLPLLVVAVLVGLAVAWFGFRIARLERPWSRFAPNPFIAELYRQIIRLVFMLVGVVIALDIIGATALLGTILGAAGIFGLAIGFAVRDSVENFLASILLSLRSPFQPMDLVEINGQQGRVVRLTSRATFLISPDGNHFRIPNATVFKSTIINYSRHPDRRLSFEVTLPDHANPSESRGVMLQTLREAPFLLADPGPSVWVEEWAGDTIRFGCVGWVQVKQADFQTARGEAIRLVKDALEDQGFRPRPDAPGTALPAPVDLTDRTQDRAVERIAEAESQDERAENLLARRPRDE